jgi:tetratricopeptide (TPR) repeat protein
VNTRASLSAQAVPPAREVREALALAYARHAAGRFQEAEEIGRAVIGIEPRNAHALHLVGEIALRRGDIDTALRFVEQATISQPRFAEAHNTLGAALKIAGRLDEAMKRYRMAVRLKPDLVEAHSNLGELLIARGEFDDAALSLRKALLINPSHVQALNNLGTALMSLNRFDEARAVLERAVALRPDFAAAWTNLGMALLGLDRPGKAISVLERAVALQPDLAATLTNLGNARQALGQPDLAADAHARAVALAPDQADCHLNYGNALRELGDLDGAIGAFRRAVALAPEFGPAHNNLGWALLQNEAWAEGWAEFEWRWRLGENLALRTRHQLPLWQGDSLQGRRILLWGEQGIGDVVLFATMLPDLLATGAQVSLELDPRLVPVFQRSFPSIAVHAWGQVSADAKFDCQANIGRLGLFLRTSAQAFATTGPHMKADLDRVAAFRERYAALGSGPRIGIAWRSASPTHRRKSLTLEHFAPLFAALPHATFISLQYGDTAEELAEARTRHGVSIFHDNTFDNWSDLDGLAAQIASLDHVVTVSNLNVHLAGALGVPTDVLLTQSALWYWPQGKTRSPWYRSVRLARTTEHAARDRTAEIAASLRAALP